MKMKCLKCEYDINLEHKVFECYEGPIFCFCCNTMMEIESVNGILKAAKVSDLLPPIPSNDFDSNFSATP